MRKMIERSGFSHTFGTKKVFMQPFSYPYVNYLIEKRHDSKGSHEISLWYSKVSKVMFHKENEKTINKIKTYRIAGLLPYNQKLPFFSPMSEAEIIVSCLSLAQFIEPMR